MCLVVSISLSDFILLMNSSFFFLSVNLSHVCKTTVTKPFQIYSSFHLSFNMPTPMSTSASASLHLSISPSLCARFPLSVTVSSLRPVSGRNISPPEVHLSSRSLSNSRWTLPSLKERGSERGTGEKRKRTRGTWGFTVSPSLLYQV